MLPCFWWVPVLCAPVLYCTSHLGALREKSKYLVLTDRQLIEVYLPHTKWSDTHCCHEMHETNILPRSNIHEIIDKADLPMVPSERLAIHLGCFPRLTAIYIQGAHGRRIAQQIGFSEESDIKAKILNASGGGGDDAVATVVAASLVIKDRDVSENSGNGPAERLKKLKELMDSGLITRAEFDSKKADILSSM
jgi:hypothetical protein